MKNAHPLTKKAVDLVRWQFRMRNLVLTCGVAKHPEKGFTVVTLPHWDVQGGMVEVFMDSASALQRYAVIVDRLRSSGWSIAAHTN